MFVFVKRQSFDTSGTILHLSLSLGGSPLLDRSDEVGFDLGLVIRAVIGFVILLRRLRRLRW